MSELAGRRTCPYCGAPAYTALEEVEHMNAMHPSIVVERYREAGMHYEADQYERQHAQQPR